MNRQDLLRAVKLAGYEAQPYADDEVRLSCPFHKDKHPSAYLSVSKKFFHCFSCKKHMNLLVFNKLFKIDFEMTLAAVENQEFQFLDILGYEKRKKEPDVGTYNEGLKLYSEGGDYRLFPDVGLYLQQRLGEGFRIPPNIVIKKNEENGTLIIKGVEQAITERFPASSKVRFKNYGFSSIFHHYKRGKAELLFIVEGFFDYLKLYNLGLDCCALMTSSLSSLKMRQLDAISGRDVVLFLDNDQAGYLGYKKILPKLLSLGKRVHKIQYLSEEHTDPGEMSYNILKETIYESLKEHPLLCSE